MAEATTEVPPANTPEARTETGEIKQATPPTTTPPTSSSEPKPEPTLATKQDDTPKDEPRAPPPDKYEFKVAEGQTISAETVEKISPVFKELGLNNEQAQKLYDLHQELSKQALDAPLKTYEKMRTDWRAEVVNDRQIGDGREGLSPSAKQDINAAFQAIGNDRLVEEFKEAVNLTGAGDHPAFLRAFAALGKNFREGQFVKPGGPAPVERPESRPRSAAAALYPNLPSSS